MYICSITLTHAHIRTYNLQNANNPTESSRFKQTRRTIVRAGRYEKQSNRKMRDWYMSLVLCMSVCGCVFIAWAVTNTLKYTIHIHITCVCTVGCWTVNLFSVQFHFLLGNNFIQTYLSFIFHIKQFQRQRLHLVCGSQKPYASITYVCLTWCAQLHCKIAEHWWQSRCTASQI